MEIRLTFEEFSTLAMKKLAESYQLSGEPTFTGDFYINPPDYVFVPVSETDQAQKTVVPGKIKLEELRQDQAQITTTKISGGLDGLKIGGENCCTVTSGKLISKILDDQAQETVVPGKIKLEEMRQDQAQKEQE